MEFWEVAEKNAIQKKLYQRRPCVKADLDHRNHLIRAQKTEPR
jgi:hypothetical protein